MNVASHVMSAIIVASLSKCCSSRHSLPLPLFRPWSKSYKNDELLHKLINHNQHISMQLAMLVVTVLATALLLLLPTTRATTQRPGELVTMPPPCRLPAVCAFRSPQVCGRTNDGLCRRFNNICVLIALNEQDLGSSSSRRQRWIHAPERDCRRVRGVGAANASWCQRDCSSRPVVCNRRSPHGQICARSLDGRLCKVLANQCQLRNKNCHTRPLNNWLSTDSSRCARMQLNDTEAACVRLETTTIPQVTIRPVLPPPPELAG